MPGVLYRCVFCDASHEVARRADGPVYLRCPTTYRWAWYDVRAFEAPRNARGTGRPAAAAASTAGARRRVRSASTGRRAGASSRAKAATSRRAGRRAPTRSSSRKRSRKGGRR